MKRIPILLVSLILAACGGGGSAADPRVDSQAIGSLSAPFAQAADPIVIAPVVQPALVPIDSCAVAKHQYGEVTYPIEYSGAFPIPIPTQKLPTSIKRGIGLKDYYPGYLGLPKGCTNRTLFAHNTYKESLDRVLMDGADSITLYNFGPWDDIKKPVFTILKSNYQVPESEMIYIIQEAKKRNLKVYTVWQFWFSDINGNQAPAQDSPKFPDFFKAAMDTWQVHVVEQAKFANQHGVDGVYVDFANYIEYFSDKPYYQEYIDKMYSIVTEVKGVYSGKLLYGQLDPTAIDARFAGKIDAIRISMGFYETSPNYITNVSVPLIKNRYDDHIKNLGQKLEKLNIPVIWVIALRSQDNAFVNGFVEDSGCVNKCEQLGAKTDFSIQAIAYEAAMESVYRQSYFQTYGVEDSSYWLTDDVAPTYWGIDVLIPSQVQYDFPNISPSIRNKPAEGIVRQWFSR